MCDHYMVLVVWMCVSVAMDHCNCARVCTCVCVCVCLHKSLIHVTENRKRAARPRGKIIEMYTPTTGLWFKSKTLCVSSLISSLHSCSSQPGAHCNPPKIHSPRPQVKPQFASWRPVVTQVCFLVERHVNQCYDGVILDWRDY